MPMQKIWAVWTPREGVCPQIWQNFELADASGIKLLICCSFSSHHYIKPFTSKLLVADEASKGEKWNWVQCLDKAGTGTNGKGLYDRNHRSIQYTPPNNWLRLSVKAGSWLVPGPPRDPLLYFWLEEAIWKVHIGSIKRKYSNWNFPLVTTRGHWKQHNSRPQH